jgi:hypothetical protein
LPTWLVIPRALLYRLIKCFKLRKQARERREYIYHKSQEAQERATYDRKQRLKAALAEGKELPTELRKEAKSLARELAFDESQQGSPAEFFCYLRSMWR